MKSYEKVIRVLKHNCAIHYPDEISQLQLLQWRKAVVNISIVPVTWNSYIRQLKNIFKLGIEHNLLPFEKNPFSNLFIREGKSKRKVFDQKQLQKISFGLKESPCLPKILQPLWFTLALIMTFRYTAIRRSQLNQLKIKDINLSEKTIYISPQINKNHEYHTLPISSILYPYLEKLLDELKKLNQSEEDQLFNINLFSAVTKRKGKKMTRNQISYLFKVITKYTGIKSSPHRFRHTAATNLMKNPENLYVAQKLLGHKDIKVTLTYIEDDVETLRKYTDTL